MTGEGEAFAATSTGFDRSKRPRLLCNPGKAMTGNAYRSSDGRLEIEDFSTLRLFDGPHSDMHFWFEVVERYFGLLVRYRFHGINHDFVGSTSSSRKQLRVLARAIKSFQKTKAAFAWETDNGEFRLKLSNSYRYGTKMPHAQFEVRVCSVADGFVFKFGKCILDIDAFGTYVSEQCETLAHLK